MITGGDYGYEIRKLITQANGTYLKYLWILLLSTVDVLSIKYVSKYEY